MTTVTIQVTRSFRQSPERVFDAWLDPAAAAQFWFATKDGEVIRCEIEPCVGGAFIIVDRRAEGDVEHVGHFVEMDRPRRLAFDFHVPAHSRDGSRVTLDFTPRADGGCDLVLTHAMPAAYANYRAQTAAGWGMILDGLGGALG